MKTCLKHLLLIPVFVSCFVSNGQNRTSFEEFNNARQKRFDAFKEEKQRRFDEFRRQRNEEFANYMRKDWVKTDVEPALVPPKDEEVPPVVVPEKDVPSVAPVPVPLPFDEVIPVPEPLPQPEPIDPISEMPVEPNPVTPIDEPSVGPQFKTQDFAFFGTPVSVRVSEKDRLVLKGVDENSIADAWLELSEDAYTNLVYDCLKIREELCLDDWPYLMMLKQMGEAVCGKDTNESVLLMAYVYCQSGYSMRLASFAGRLHMLYASNHKIYDIPYFSLDDEWFYTMGEAPSELFICDRKYPGEKEISLLVTRPPKLAMLPAKATTHTSVRHPDMTASVAANQNMLRFYDSYPASMVNDNIMTRWAMYANMPMPDYIREDLYPQIIERISGLNQLDALNKVLHWVQTGFKYEYDDIIWGDDRAFFPEESLHYPYCDCEDRSILLTRIVRDVLGLPCVLVFYPGHLAAAVAVTEGNPTGDYFSYDGKRFFVTDGTIMGYGASVGKTMTGMDNAIAKLILLK